MMMKKKKSLESDTRKEKKGLRWLGTKNIKEDYVKKEKKNK
jgi:hypothetical protein